jgi:hypothetical protein
MNLKKLNFFSRTQTPEIVAFPILMKGHVVIYHSGERPHINWFVDISMCGLRHRNSHNETKIHECIT